MIDEFSVDTTGWARFSDDRLMRYRLARSFTPFSPEMERLQGAPRVVFLMLNPSTADAFKLDRTVSRCCDFAKRWGADVLEVVNLFAFRSPYPRDLKRQPKGQRGDDAINDAQIVDACRGAKMVVAAWGNDGALDWRDHHVRRLVAAAGVQLHHLGLTLSGRPKHTHARGVHRIPDDQEPAPWSVP